MKFDFLPLDLCDFELVDLNLPAYLLISLST